MLTPDGHTPRTLRLLADAGIPVIEIWEEPEQPVQHVVGFSNRRAMRALVESLAAAGYRRMTFVGEGDDEGTRGAARRSGYRDAVESLGLGPPRVCALGRPPVTMSDGAQALDLVLERFPDTDLVVCVSIRSPSASQAPAAAGESRCRTILRSPASEISRSRGSPRHRSPPQASILTISRIGSRR